MIVIYIGYYLSFRNNHIILAQLRPSGTRDRAILLKEGKRDILYYLLYPCLYIDNRFFHVPSVYFSDDEGYIILGSSRGYVDFN